MSLLRSTGMRIYAALSVAYLVLVAVIAWVDYQDDLTHDYIGALVIPYPSTLLTLPTVLFTNPIGQALARAFADSDRQQRALGWVIPALLAAPLQVVAVGALVVAGRAALGRRRPPTGPFHP